MTKRTTALGAHFKYVIAASFLTFTIAAAAAAFAIGFTGALNQSLADPNSAPLARITLFISTANSRTMTCMTPK